MGDVIVSFRAKRRICTAQRRSLGRSGFLRMDPIESVLTPVLLRFDQLRVVSRSTLLILERAQLRQHRVVVLSQVLPEIELTELQLPRFFAGRNTPNLASQTENWPRKPVAQLDRIHHKDRHQE